MLTAKARRAGRGQQTFVVQRLNAEKDSRPILE